MPKFVAKDSGQKAAFEGGGDHVKGVFDDRCLWCRKPTDEED